MIKKSLLFVVLLLVSTLSLMALEVGVIYNGNLHGSNDSFLGLTARSRFGIAGLELSLLPKVSPDFDMTSYRIIVAPSIGWGTPELSIFGSVSPHLEINKGKLDFDVAKWNIGVGSTFMIAENIISFFEFFAEFDLSGNTELESITSATMLSIGVTYKFDFGF